MKKPSNIKAPQKGKTEQDRLAPISKISDEQLHREYIEYLYQDFRDDPSETIRSFIGRDSVQIIQKTIDLFASDLDGAVLKRLRRNLVEELNESQGEDDTLDSWDAAIAESEEAYLKSGSTPVERIGSNITTASRIKLFSKYLNLLAHACSHMSSDRCISDHLCNLFSNNRYIARYRLLQCAKIPKDIGDVLANFIREKCTITKQTSFSRAEANQINDDFDKQFPNKRDYKIQNLRITIPEDSQNKKIDDIWIEITWADANLRKRLGKKNAIMFLALIDNYLKKNEVGLSSVIVAKLYERYGVHLADDKMDKDTQTTISHLKKKEGALAEFNDLFFIQVGKMDWQLKFKKRVTIQCDRDLLKTMVGPR